jgi:ribosomal-protein-alanine N-acetyltransferase
MPTLQPFSFGSLLLEPLRLTDIDGVFTLWSDFETIRFTNWHYTPTRAECDERLFSVLDHYGREPRNFGPYALRSKGGFVGMAGADLFDASSSEYEVWFAISREHWRRGYGTLAVSALIERMRTSGRVSHLRATVVTLNIASQKLLEKHGLERRGVLPRGHQRHGLTLDLYVYACALARANVVRPLGDQAQR